MHLFQCNMTEQLVGAMQDYLYCQSENMFSSIRTNSLELDTVYIHVMYIERCDGSVVIGSNPGSTGSGSIPGLGDYVVSLSKILYSRCFSPPRCISGYQ